MAVVIATSAASGGRPRALTVATTARAQETR
jgi:hypothetical protein